MTIMRRFVSRCGVAAVAACLGAVGLALAPSAAEARSSTHVYIGIGTPYYGYPAPYRRAWLHPRPYYRPYHVVPPPVYYVPPPPVVYAPPPAYYGAPAAPVYGAPARETCREFQTTVRIGGVPEPGYGTACLQPDGTWRVVR